MKKTILFAVLLSFVVGNLNAQDDSNYSSTDVTYGVKAGYNSFIARASADGNSATVNSSGFYFGVFADIIVSEKFNIQPELLCAIVSEDGENGNLLVLPILGKYKVNDEFSLLAGPQLDFILDEDSEGIKKFGVGLALGLAYDIDEHFLIDMRYSFGLSDRLENAEEDFGESDVKVKFNFFQVGVGYRF